MAIRGKIAYLNSVPGGAGNTPGTDTRRVVPVLNQRITRSCPVCGTALTRRTQTKFCSTDCKKASQIRPLHDRFWDLIQKTDTCWLWSGPVINSGYGHISA